MCGQKNFKIIFSFPERHKDTVFRLLWKIKFYVSVQFRVFMILHQQIRPYYDFKFLKGKPTLASSQEFEIFIFLLLNLEKKFSVNEKALILTSSMFL